MTRAGRNRVDEVRVSDLVVVGAGAAGLSAALAAAPRAVTMLTRRPPGRAGATPLAQGGIAAASAPEDSAALHAADTLAAAAGIADPDAVARLTREGPFAIDWLSGLGVAFDRDPEGCLDLGREGAHSRDRIHHAAGDATGAELARVLAERVRRSEHVEIVAETVALGLHLERGRVAGVVATSAGRRVLFLARGVILATGGIGGIYSRTTNPSGAVGGGLAMAARAGALLADLEMVQFHPTALAVGEDPMPLVTEALRGAGATLVDGTGRRLLVGHPAAELAPRDIVARAIWTRLERGDRVFLDASRRPGESFPTRFPTVFELCRRHGIDPRVEPIPVSPAAHYHMGGVLTDRAGRSSLPGLSACGEVASTGVHGANRLASNSLLEAVVFGFATGRAAGRASTETPPAKALVSGLSGGAGRSRRGEGAAETWRRTRDLLWRQAGLVRTEEGLEKAAGALEEMAGRGLEKGTPAEVAIRVGQLVVAAARIRRESRGGHFRADHPAPDAAWRHRLVVDSRWAGRRLEGLHQVEPGLAEPADRLEGGRR